MQYPVSLIISFYNKIDFLKLIFAALEKQSYREFEVVIADDGSCQEVVDQIQQLANESSFQVKHVWHEDQGWRKNIILNKAIVASEADYLIFIDGDCIPHPHVIQEHFEGRKPMQVICGRRVTLTRKISDSLSVSKVGDKNFHCKLIVPLLLEAFKGEETHIKQMIRTRSRMIKRLFGKDKIKGFWGCNFSLSKEDILSVNGFDERYIHPSMGEDTDLDFRLRNNGVFPYSKKFLVTIYHIHHTHNFDEIHEMNYRLFDENVKGKVAYTPFGICQSADIEINNHRK